MKDEKQRMIRVLIVDDHAIVREGIKLILCRTHDMQPEAVSGGAEVYRKVRNEAWDVVVLDIILPSELSRLGLLREVKRLCSTLSVLVLSVHPEDQYGVQALKAGAAGYVNISSSSTELVKAIRKVAAGGRYISPALAEALAQRLNHGGDAAPADVLSTREFEVYAGLAAGETPTAISRSLGLSIKTISTYRSRILEKLHLKTNYQLVHYAIQRDLIQVFNRQGSLVKVEPKLLSAFSRKQAV